MAAWRIENRFRTAVWVRSYCRALRWCSIGDCQSGQVDISRFSLDNVSSLTLTIGQSDNIYQTARMLAAASALSIETSRPDFENRDFSLSAKVKTGSYGLANPSLFYAHRFTSRLSCSLYGEYLRADGNYHFTMMNLTKPIEGRRNNSRHRGIPCGGESFCPFDGTPGFGCERVSVRFPSRIARQCGV